MLFRSAFNDVDDGMIWTKKSGNAVATQQFCIYMIAQKQMIMAVDDVKRGC